MITFENTEVIGWEHAIRGMRNPLNSWDKSDSDLDLMMKLRNAGTDHRKFMRMIVVYVDITAPLYWWKEFDTYKVGTVANSCSTMHTIYKKEFAPDDFSNDHLINYEESLAIWREDHDLDPRIEDEDPAKYPEEATEMWSFAPMDILILTIKALNHYRDLYLKTKDKKYWWQMIQLLPTSYNQKRTVMLNYEVLTNIYKSRKDHKLDEWHEFCCWIQHLPYSELIVGHKKLPSTEELDELFEEVKKVDGRIAFRSLTKIDNMQKLDFYDADGKILYSVDLNRNSLVEIFDWIKKSCWHMAKQTLQFGA